MNTQSMPVLTFALRSTSPEMLRARSGETTDSNNSVADVACKDVLWGSDGLIAHELVREDVRLHN